MTGKLIKSTTICIFVCLLLFGCTRDDLCPAGAAVTPNLIITFHNSDRPEARKQVGLNVFVDNPDRSPVVEWQVLDSVALPLKVNADRTDFIFQKYLISNTDTLYWEDKIRFSYDRKDIYVNRACGFRAEFFEFTAIAESHHWIDELLIKKDSVVDEKTAHLTIFH